MKRGYWGVNCCDAQMTGFNTCHCTVCCNSFVSPAGFDKHRGYGKCWDPATVKNGRGELMFHDAGRPYPCWSRSDGRDRSFE